MIRTIVSNFEDQNIKKVSKLVIQHTVTNPEEIKQLKGLMHTAEFYYNSNKAPSSLAENDVQLDTTYSYLAPASTFSILFQNTPSLSNNFYIHKSTNDPIALVFWFLFPLLCILTHKQYPFYSSSPFNNILPKLAIILEKANENKWGSVLTYIYIKELLVAYFSYKVSPNDYYCWPNEENKNSAINDFFELFLLKNINKMTTNSAIDIEQNKNYYLGSKFVNLVYIPKNIFLPKKYKEINDPLRTICIPIIFDHKHSWKEVYQVILTKNFDYSFKANKPWNVMDIKNYFSDTNMYGITEVLKKNIENTLKSKESDLEFVAFNNNKENYYIMPGMREDTSLELYMNFLIIFEFYMNPTNQNKENLLVQILENPDLISINLDNLLKEKLLLVLKEIRSAYLQNEFEDKFGYYIRNLLLNIISGFTAKPLNINKEIFKDIPNIKEIPFFKEKFNFK